MAAKGKGKGKPGRKKKSAGRRPAVPDQVAASAPLEAAGTAIARWWRDPLHEPSRWDSIRDCIEGQTRDQPMRTFLISEEDGREFSYLDLDRETSVTVNLFRALGAGPGDRIGVLDANTPEFVFLYLGCMKGGFCSAPLNYHLKAPELQFCLENSESVVLFVAAEFWGEIEKALPGLGFLRAVVLLGTPPEGFAKGHRLHVSLESLAAAGGAREGERGGVDGGVGGKDLGPPPIGAFETIRSGIAPVIPKSHPRPGAETPGEIIYTSGTTGKPKGVVLRHHQFLSDAKYIARWYRMTRETRMMMVLPLFHVNAEVVTVCTPLVAGGSVVMFRKFSASRFWETAARYGVHVVSVVPTILTVLLSHEEKMRGEGGVAGAVGATGAVGAKPPGLLQTIICGAAPLPAELQLSFEKTFLVPITEGFGLSETTCYSTFNPVEGWRKIATIGVAVGNECAIWDGEGREAPRGGLGEIVIRGENVMQEYFKRPEANAEAFAGGWFHSGDIGDCDGDGFFRIRDRKKDMIIRGGENIYPREIDEVLYAHPAVENAATIGVPSAKYGEEVVSFVVARGSAGVLGVAGDGAKKLEAELIAFCKERLANYKVPRSVRFVAEIPKGPSGKLLRRVLRDMAAGKE